MVSNFLSLAPETSSSYPTRRAGISTADAAATTAGAATTSAAATTDAGTTAAADAAAKEATSAVDLTASHRRGRRRPWRASPCPEQQHQLARLQRGSSSRAWGPVHFGGDPREADFVPCVNEDDFVPPCCASFCLLFTAVQGFARPRSLGCMAGAPCCSVNVWRGGSA